MLCTTASYLTNIRSCTLHPHGSNIFAAANGTQLIKFSLDGSFWLDPSTFIIMFDVCYTHANMANKLCPIGCPWSFFPIMRILVGLLIWEDIDLYHTDHDMFNHFTMEGSRYNYYAEGFGNALERGGVYASRARNFDPAANKVMQCLLSNTRGIRLNISDRYIQAVVGNLQ